MSNIEWTDQTWNPVVGCTPVSPGCLNCYAATMARRLEGMGVEQYQPATRLVPMGPDRELEETPYRIAEVVGGRAVFTGLVRTVPERLAEPLSWRKPRMCFVCSMSDLFHESVPFEYIDKVFAVMALTPHVTYQVLTKRPARMAEYLAGGQNRTCGGAVWRAADQIADERGGDPDIGKLAMAAFVRNSQGGGPDNALWPLANVWLGTSVEDQARADERIPHLLRCPAAVRFLSVEPLLGAVKLPAWLTPVYVNEKFQGWEVPWSKERVHGSRELGDHFLHWVIVGGESGPEARPTDVGHIRSVVRQCRQAGVPVFVKQLGAKVTGPSSEEHWRRCADKDLVGVRVPHGADMPWTFRDRKGGDMAEWPEDLRVREWPKVVAQKGGG